MNSPLMKTQPHRQPQNKTVSTLNSTDALAMVEHSSELTLNISTPVGTKFLTTTNFIGTHSDQCIVIEIPKISDDDLAFFFQQGFWVNVRALSHRGEGAIIHFRCQLQHIIFEPLPMIMLSIPNTMQVTQLRKEIRYDVNLAAKAFVSDHKVECEIRDLSKSGCRFITPPIGRPIQIGDDISIEIKANSQKGQFFAPLKGRVCNLQKSTHYSKYGLEFNDDGKTNAKNLLGQLKFDGAKLRLQK